MFFHALKFAKSKGSCLNMRLSGREFKHLLREPASVNKMKQTCVIIIFLHILPEFAKGWTENTLKYHFLHWFSPNKMASALNFRTS